MGFFCCFRPSRMELSSKIDDSRYSCSEYSDRTRQDVLFAGCAVSFSFRDLATATQHFKEVNLLGEGGFGKVYKGKLESGQVVAIKQLNLEGMQGAKEFLTEVLILSTLRHSNLVNLVGYCTEGDQRLLVYEFMPKGSLEDHLFDPSPHKPQLDWNIRMKIALGAAQGLAYLHDIADPPVIYRDMKAANVLLDDDFNPKLSDFGLAKIGPVGDNTHVSTRVMGTYGYCAPDYALSGKLTMKSDIYSFGVLLLELITGRKAFDSSKAATEQNLVTWARAFFNDRRQFKRLADPSLRGCFPSKAFHQLVVIASMCLQEQSHFRPIIADVVVALNYVASQTFFPEAVSRISCSPSSYPSPHDSRTRSRFPTVETARVQSQFAV